VTTVPTFEPDSSPGCCSVDGLCDRAARAQAVLTELQPVFERYDLLVHPEMPVLPP